MKFPNFIRIFALGMLIPVGGASLRGAEQPARLRFQLSFPAAVRSEAADGRPSERRLYKCVSRQICFRH